MCACVCVYSVWAHLHALFVVIAVTSYNFKMYIMCLRRILHAKHSRPANSDNLLSTATTRLSSFPLNVIKIMFTRRNNIHVLALLSCISSTLYISGLHWTIHARMRGGSAHKRLFFRGWVVVGFVIRLLLCFRWNERRTHTVAYHFVCTRHVIKWIWMFGTIMRARWLNGIEGVTSPPVLPEANIFICTRAFIWFDWISIGGYKL